MEQAREPTPSIRRRILNNSVMSLLILKQVPNTGEF
jgi:hypothetical protein